MAVAAGTVRRRNPIVVEDRRAGWVFLIPAMSIFLVFIFGSLLFAIYLSLHDYRLLQQGGIWKVFTDPGNTWIGIGNYRDVLNNADFWRAFRNTTWYAIGVVPAQTTAGLVLAVLANRKIRGRTFFRTAFYFPSISSSVVISIIFLWMYSARGFVNFVLRELGFPTPRPVWLANPRGVIELAVGKVGIDGLPTWLEGPSVAMLSIMMLNVWTTTGTIMVIFLAGLQNLPGDVYEAAALDGASKKRQFYDITIPLLKPIIGFAVTIGIIGTFQVFDQIWVMSGGGPQKTTTTMAYLIYVEGFEQGRGLGYACAIAVILLALIMTLYLIQRRFTELDEARAARIGPPGGIRGWLMHHLGRERGTAGAPTGV
jgi:multiple sugar transport system permease protein